MSNVINSRDGITANDPGTDYTRIGTGRYLPVRYTVTADLPDLPLIHLTVSVEDGQPVVADVRLERRAGAPPITSTILRDIPLKTIVRESVAVAGVVQAFRKADDDDPNADDAQVLEYGSPELAVAVQDSLLSAYDARQGVPITDEVLQKVAEIYRGAHAAGKPPTKAVELELVVSRSTAGRYVQRARERGFLGPTRERVAGA
jgi:hypothetical protein